jgi:hypothetical protein
MYYLDSLPLAVIKYEIAKMKKSLNTLSVD